MAALWLWMGWRLWTVGCERAAARETLAKKSNQ
jgi:hypothetical protein